MPAPSLDILKLVSQDSKIQTHIGLNTLLEGLTIAVTKRREWQWQLATSRRCLLVLPLQCRPQMLGPSIPLVTNGAACALYSSFEAAVSGVLCS